MEQTIIRPLSPSERRFVSSGVFGYWTVPVTGDFDPDAMRAAFTALQHAYPVLSCRIVTLEDGDRLVRPTEFPAEGAWVRAGDPEPVRAPAGFTDPDRQLAYLDIVCGRDGARVTLFVHHSIADARHDMELFARLWDLYAGHPASVAEQPAPQDYPQSLEWHVTTRGIERGPRSGLEPVYRPMPDEPETVGEIPYRNILARPDRLILDAEITTGIVESGRRTGLSVNSLVSAALLRAYATVASTDGSPVPVGVLAAVDLRSRLLPAVSATGGTTMSTFACFDAEIETATAATDLARRIGDRLRTDLDSGVVAQSVLHFPDLFGDTRKHSLAGHISLTNLGAIPALRTPAGLTVTDYETGFHLAHPRPSAADSPAALLQVYTYAGRMTIGYVGDHLGTDAVLDAIRAELTEVSR
ncbi:acyltransferase [Nocardia terpenica]|uniref:phthiocerol/phthiodiolone dimycocerosyl transferase family protein n=1 Tax=Nocardia terpenica TaxID=455432 RepID=UPI001894DA32|nr:acyltransferase [Nocardia terpenica]MBF6065721.1 acyltransferase [Nocardia terpenica]MBF6108241.1 acyltransferase [Nocardia terpenica]MBF6115836.1 acyltransferase [Nocardia terpenica]MBF6122966.1 acyltransferase [Nocardia terpenica]MBF6155961.1 acyltransferase [Nocardia terpenica]